VTLASGIWHPEMGGRGICGLGSPVWRCTWFGTGVLVVSPSATLGEKYCARACCCWVGGRGLSLGLWSAGLVIPSWVRDMPRGWGAGDSGEVGRGTLGNGVLGVSPASCAAPVLLLFFDPPSSYLLSSVVRGLVEGVLGLLRKSVDLSRWGWRVAVLLSVRAGELARLMVGGSIRLAWLSSSMSSEELGSWKL